MESARAAKCDCCGETIPPGDECACAECHRVLCDYCADKAGCCGWVPARVEQVEDMTDACDPNDTGDWKIEELGGES